MDAESWIAMVVLVLALLSLGHFMRAHAEFDEAGVSAPPPVTERKQ